MEVSSCCSWIFLGIGHIIHYCNTHYNTCILSNSGNRLHVNVSRGNSMV